MLGHPDLQRHVNRFYGKYSGVVVRNNEDPNHRGNLVVKVPSVLGELEVVARACLPYGHFFIPPPQTRIWVEFEAGDTSQPLWVGTWYQNGATPPEAAVSPPDNRVIQTASGHTVEIQDKGGEERILIRHKGNAFVSIDKNGSVLIANQKGSHLFLDAEGAKVSLMEEHSNVLTLTENGVVVVNSDGATLEMKGSMVRVSAKEILLQGTTVALGDGAAEPAVLGLTFSTIFAAHTHPSAMGPTGPPIPAPLFGPAPAGQGLSSVVLLK